MANAPLSSQRNGSVVTVTINIPPHNIVGAELVVGLFGLLPELEADESVSVVVFRSSDPDFFLMHGDVQAILNSEPLTESITEPNVAAALFERLHNAPFLTIGFLDGYARGGGCEFLSALDIRVGSIRAIIGQPEVPMGILPGAGGTVRLARQLGRAKALEVILSGQDIGVQELLSIGWLQSVLVSDDLAIALDVYVDRFSSLDRQSVLAVKRVMNAALADDPAALTIESEELNAAMLAGRHLEPMRRFLAAGGQTRRAEAGSIEPLLDAMRNVK